ncbi:hypothetical protein [Zavarzinia sp. CC-PAN008]|uniref:hypothetical protein n=1 Tax=Zavarzinia sp. CC-PAN008 TaxID=3243332 RepID=UPI003F745A7D
MQQQTNRTDDAPVDRRLDQAGRLHVGRTRDALAGLPIPNRHDALARFLGIRVPDGARDGSEEVSAFHDRMTAIWTDLEECFGIGGVGAWLACADSHATPDAREAFWRDLQRVLQAR